MHRSIRLSILSITHCKFLPSHRSNCQIFPSKIKSFLLATSEYFDKVLQKWLPSKMLGVFACDLQLTVTLTLMRLTLITRLQTYFRNYFQASLSGLFYRVLVCALSRSAVVLASILVSSLFCLFIHMCLRLPTGEKMSTGRLENGGSDKCR